MSEVGNQRCCADHMLWWQRRFLQNVFCAITIGWRYNPTCSQAARSRGDRPES